MSDFKSGDAIGGYYSVQINKSNEKFDNCIHLVSARYAFELILKTVSPKKVYLPSYICDVMVSILSKMSVEYEFYHLSDNFVPLVEDIALSEKEYFLLVDYFGVSSNLLPRLISQFGGDKIILDCSQSLFFHSTEVLATLYSPRKFLGLPDGGILKTNLDIERPSVRDTTSYKRLTHLFIRYDRHAEDGYNFYQKAEEQIGKIEGGMSNLTRSLLDSYDLNEIERKRKDNYNYLHDKLGKHNKLNIAGNFPALVYPFLINHGIELKKHLAKNRVYLATYWPDALHRDKLTEFEVDLVNNLLAIPCDQRYSTSDLDEILYLINQKFTVNEKNDF